jgi:transcriptional/translational regulatory protein YebC/TACO1
VRDAYKKADLQPEQAEITQRAATLVELDIDTGQKMLKFLDMLEDLDDTQDVWSNAEIPAEAYE